MKIINLVMGLLLILFVSCSKAPNYQPANTPTTSKGEQFPKADGDIRILSYNIKQCVGRDKLVNLQRVANVLKSIDADIVCMQEVDDDTDRTGRVHQTKELAKSAGYNYYYFGEAYKFVDAGYGAHGAFGTAILMKEKPLSTTVVKLPHCQHSSSHKVYRSVTFAEFENFVVGSMHLDSDSGGSSAWQARVNSIPLINDQVKSYNKPVFLAGDYNDGELDGAFFTEFKKFWSIATLTNKHTFKGRNGSKHTVDFVSVFNTAPVEATFSDVVYRAVDADPENASDHYPVIADFPRNVSGVIDPDAPTESMTANEIYKSECVFTNSSIAVAPNGNLAFGTDANADRDDENIVLISAKGKKLGSYLAAGTVRSSASFGDNNRFYIGSYNDTFFSFDPEAADSPAATFTGEGNVKYNASAIDKDGKIYAPIHGKLYSLNDNGTSFTKNWEVAFSSTNLFSSPIIDSENVYLIDEKGEMKAISKSSGDVLWTTVIGTKVQSYPAMGSDGTIYVSGLSNETDSFVKAINPVTGETKWSKAMTDETIGVGCGIALSLDKLYIGTKSGKMHCFNQEDGQREWVYKTNASKEIACVPAIDSEGNIYFGDFGGYFYALKPDGELRYRTIKLGEKINSSPAISGSTIYIGVNQGSALNDGGIVYAITDAATAPMASWSMMGGNAHRNGRVY